MYRTSITKTYVCSLLWSVNVLFAEVIVIHFEDKLGMDTYWNVIIVIELVKILNIKLKCKSIFVTFSFSVNESVVI